MNTRIVKLSIVALVSVLYGLSFGQWSSNGYNVYLSNSWNNVGIGINTPFNKLDVDGNLGIRDHDLLFRGTEGQDLNQGIGWYGVNKLWNGIEINGPVLYGWGGGILGSKQWDTRTSVLFWNTANVGIGQSPGAERLEVNGNIKCDAVKIGNWTINAPDYVFEKDYNLPSLKSVEEHITLKKHLPGIPSASEMKKNGVDLSELNMTLLKKIEELTLYTIELNKKIEALEKNTAEK